MSRHILVVADSSTQFKSLYLPFKEELITRSRWVIVVNIGDALIVYWYQKRDTITDQMLDLKYNSVIWMCDKQPSKLEEAYLGLLCDSHIYFTKEDI